MSDWDDPPGYWGHDPREDDPTVADLVESAQLEIQNLPMHTDQTSANYHALNALCEAILLQQREIEEMRQQMSRLQRRVT